MRKAARELKFNDFEYVKERIYQVSTLTHVKNLMAEIQSDHKPYDSLCTLKKVPYYLNVYALSFRGGSGYTHIFMAHNPKLEHESIIKFFGCDSYTILEK